MSSIATNNYLSLNSASANHNKLHQTSATSILRQTAQTAATSPLLSQNLQQTPPELILGQYQIIEKIGSGTFGNVYKCLDIINQELVAIKKLKKVYDNPDDAYNLREVRVLNAINQFNHPNIIQTKRIEVENGTLFIVLEHMDMNLTEFMKDKARKENRRLTEQEIRIIMK